MQKVPKNHLATSDANTASVIRAHLFHDVGDAVSPGRVAGSVGVHRIAGLLAARGVGPGRPSPLRPRLSHPTVSGQPAQTILIRICDAKIVSMLH